MDQGDPSGLHAIGFCNSPALSARLLEALVCQVRTMQGVPIGQVRGDFARAEGEGTPAEWCAAHQACFARNGGFSPDMPLVCERFRLTGGLA